MNVFDQLLTMFNAKITDSIMREAWLCIVSVLIEYVLHFLFGIMVCIMARFTCISPQDTYWCRYEGIDAGYDTEQDM